MNPKNLSRRQFIQKSSVAAGALSLAATAMTEQTFPADKQKYSPNDKIRVGLIGCGMIGIPNARDALKIPGVELPIVCDLYDGRLARCKEIFGSNTITTKDYQDILKREDIDAVIIATPDHWHKDMTIQALEAGKDVYLQKPATLKWQEGVEMIKVQQKTKRLVQVGSQGISAPYYKLIRQKIKKGEIGQVTLVECHNHRNSYIGAWYYPIPYDASPTTCDWDRFLGPAPKIPWNADRFFRWRCYWDYSGGLPTDLFVHMITAVHYLMDVKMANSAWGTGRIFRFTEAGREVPDQVNAVAEYDNFTLLLNCTNNNQHDLPFITIYGTEGTIVLQGGGFTQYYQPAREDFSGTISTWPEAQQAEYRAREGLNDEDQPFKNLLPAAEPVRFEMEMEGTTVTHLRNLFQCMRTRQNTLEDMRTGHLAATVAHMVNISQKEGRILKWDQKKEVVV